MIHRDYFAEKFELDLSQPSPIKIFKINRQIMARCLASLGYKTGAEVGVAAGDHSRLLLKSIPGLTLYAVDIWEDAAAYDEAVKNLKRFKGCTIRRQPSLEAARSFADHSLDFVYIDAAHDFKSIADDLCTWRPKVRSGGILFGHDFHRNNGCKVSDVVTAYATAFNLKPWFVLGMGAGTAPIKNGDMPGFGKLEGPYYEYPPGWMFLL